MQQENKEMADQTVNATKSNKIVAASDQSPTDLEGAATADVAPIEKEGASADSILLASNAQILSEGKDGDEESDNDSGDQEETDTVVATAEVAEDSNNAEGPEIEDGVASSEEEESGGEAWWLRRLVRIGYPRCIGRWRQ